MPSEEESEENFREISAIGCQKRLSYLANSQKVKKTVSKALFPEEIYETKREIQKLNEKGLLKKDVKKRIKQNFSKLQTSTKQSEVQRYKDQIRSTIDGQEKKIEEKINKPLPKNVGQNPSANPKPPIKKNNLTPQSEEISPYQSKSSLWDLNVQRSDQAQNNAILKEMISNTEGFPDEDLFKFLADKKINPQGGWFFNHERDPPIERDLAKLILSKRGQSIQDFFRYQQLLFFHTEWNKPESNKKQILSDLISSNVFDIDLYRFLVNEAGAQEILQKSLELLDKFSKTRGNFDQFFKKNFLRDANSQWNQNVKLGDDYGNNQLLKNLIAQVEVVSDSQLINFFKNVSIKSRGGWFKLENQDTPLFINLKTQRPGIVNDPFFAEEVAAPVEVNASNAIEDPLSNLITLNCHGAFSNQTFELPPDVYVMAPHPEGFNAQYTLSSPPGGKSFEEELYGGNPNGFSIPSSGGWKVYKPGEIVRNVNFSPWSGSTNTQEEFNTWKESSGQQDYGSVPLFAGKPPKFAMVPTRKCRVEANGNVSYPQCTHNSKGKNKIKVFGNTNLQDVIKELKNKQPEGPIILIPFTCNAGEGPNQSIHCHGQNRKQISTFFNP